MTREIMDLRRSVRHRPGALALWAACLLLPFSPPSDAAVAILSVEGAPELVLVDAGRLQPEVLGRLAAAGFVSARQFETGCEVVDAGLLADRLQWARRVVALVAPADASLVESLWMEQGGSVESGAPSEALLRLRAALGDARRELVAMIGRRPGAGALTGDAP
ncbi:MAG: hypothetical protein RLZZ393_844 [Pseudomonadota bacterium]